MKGHPGHCDCPYFTTLFSFYVSLRPTILSLHTQNKTYPFQVNFYNNARFTATLTQNRHFLFFFISQRTQLTVISPQVPGGGAWVKKNRFPPVLTAGIKIK
jgi:hypothetical protein